MCWTISLPLARLNADSHSRKVILCNSVVTDQSVKLRLITWITRSSTEVVSSGQSLWGNKADKLHLFLFLTLKRCKNWISCTGMSQQMVSHKHVLCMGHSRKRKRSRLPSFRSLFNKLLWKFCKMNLINRKMLLFYRQITDLKRTAKLNWHFRCRK